MGRSLRPNLPGGIFHLTARVLHGERLFTPDARSAALRIIASGVELADLRLLAVAIMPNHLHLVVQQGEQPVWMLMHGVVRRLAHMLQGAHKRTGPIFWRPYGATPCMSPRHARHAIVYTHLNPVRGRLCTDPLAYAWTSHRVFVDDGSGSPRTPELARIGNVLARDAALRLFAVRADRSPKDLQDDYAAFVAWRTQSDRLLAGLAVGPSAVARPAPPVWGDLFWDRTFSPFFHASARGRGHGRVPRPDPFAPSMGELARGILAEEGNCLGLEDVRGRNGGPQRVSLRRRMILRMHHAGYPSVRVARFLGISESAVSRVVVAARRARSTPR